MYVGNDGDDNRHHMRLPFACNSIRKYGAYFNSNNLCCYIQSAINENITIFNRFFLPKDIKMTGRECHLRF